MGASDIEDLYKASLYINVATKSHDRELRGRIVPQMMSEAHESLKPVMLTGPGTEVSGIAWANMDSTCSLHYEVRVGGPGAQD